MQKIIDNFLEITKISRCSFQTEKMELFLIELANRYGYSVRVDRAKNILISHSNPKLCLQAHYDMVCIGDAPNIESVIEGNILKAKNSSLGADNGIAIAMMMQLMKEQAPLEFLFTSDEEVGLIGAKNLELTVKSDKLLNLDSEEEAKVYIGCAGGVDLKLTKELQSFKEDGNFYELTIGNLPGGHSGVDIDKNIPNAIVELAKFIKNSGAKVASFSGGERINSIPVNAKVLVVSKNPLKSNGTIEVTPASKESVTNFDIEDLLNLPNGVLEYNSGFNVVETSANVALIELLENKVTLEVSLRSLDTQKLMDLAESIQKEYEAKGYSIELNDKYPGWKPEINQFTKSVEAAVKKVYKVCELKVIHAGLECGILSEKLPNTQMASIGPNIYYPHSIREYVEIDSVGRTYEVVKEVIDSL